MKPGNLTWPLPPGDGAGVRLPADTDGGRAFLGLPPFVCMPASWGQGAEHVRPLRTTVRASPPVSFASAVSPQPA